MAVNEAHEQASAYDALTAKNHSTVWINGGEETSPTASTQEDSSNASNRRGAKNKKKTGQT